MSWITIVEGKAVVSPEGMSLPLVQKVYKVDKKKGKPSFEVWMRFLFFAFFKDSIYINYLPREREQKVVETIFPDKSVTYFHKITGMDQLIKFTIGSTYTFKEKLYRRLLEDIEDEMDRLSKIKSERMARVKGNREIRFVSSITQEEVKEIVPLDVMVKIDNSEEKLKSMDVIDKLMKREKLLKEELKKEEIARNLEESSGRYKFDN